MQAVAKSGRNALHAGLQQASRLISTTVAAMGVGQDEGERRRTRNRQKQDSYKPWAREVYGSKTSPRAQGEGWQPPAQQQAEGRQQQQHGSKQPSRWRPRSRAPEVEGNLRMNYAVASPSLEGHTYVRVAPRGEQRQFRMWPAYIYNVNQSLLRQDIASFFDGFNLSVDEIRPEYSWKHFATERFWLNFSTEQDRVRAMSRHLAYLGTRRALMRTATPHEFSNGIYNPLAMSSRGRYVLVDNLAQSSTSEDVIRFFQNYDLHAKSVTFLRDQEKGKERSPRVGPRYRENSEKAIVRFTSPMEAHRAVRDRQGEFCGNNQVRLRVLQ